MNIALIGYGKMGREVEAAAKEKGIGVIRIFSRGDNPNSKGLTPASLSGVEVCIDFSIPAAAVDNIKAVAACGKNIVTGTTGWLEKLEEVKSIVSEKQIGFLYTSNFSIGVNIFMQIVENAAEIINRYPDYDIALSEIHHTKKADSPSGTALSLASIILEHTTRKTQILSGTPKAEIAPHELQITSARVGKNAGTHSVMIDSEYDSIQLTHTAKNRRGFALGALAAAEWLNGKKGMFTMKDVIAR